MNDLVASARITARSAHLLLESGDYRGAVNRAYYAMFDLARPALAAIDPKLAAAKKHGTVIGRFSKHAVEDMGLPRDLGRSLRLAFDARLVADYSDVGASQEQAEAAVEAMDRFLEAVLGHEESS